MLRNSCIIAALALAAAVVLSGVTAAGDCCCDHCGCQNSCNKVCKLVPDERKVETTCWGCKCEEFCVTGPSCSECEQCETVCDPCENGGDPKAPVGKAKRLVWKLWGPPCSAKMYTKKKLYKKTITKKVPGYKWVVEDLCAQCEANRAAAGPAPETASLPPAPAIEGAADAPGLIQPPRAVGK